MSLTARLIENAPSSMPCSFRYGSGCRTSWWTAHRGVIRRYAPPAAQGSTLAPSRKWTSCALYDMASARRDPSSGDEARKAPVPVSARELFRLESVGARLLGADRAPAASAAAAPSPAAALLRTAALRVLRAAAVAARGAGRRVGGALAPRRRVGPGAGPLALRPGRPLAVAGGAGILLGLHL